MERARLANTALWGHRWWIYGDIRNETSRKENIFCNHFKQNIELKWW